MAVKAQEQPLILTSQAAGTLAPQWIAVAVSALGPLILLGALMQGAWWGVAVGALWSTVGWFVTRNTLAETGRLVREGSGTLTLPGAVSVPGSLRATASFTAAALPPGSVLTVTVVEMERFNDGESIISRGRQTFPALDVSLRADNGQSVGSIEIALPAVAAWEKTKTAEGMVCFDGYRIHIERKHAQDNAAEQNKQDARRALGLSHQSNAFEREFVLAARYCVQVH